MLLNRRSSFHYRTQTVLSTQRHHQQVHILETYQVQIMWSQTAVMQLVSAVCVCVVFTVLSTQRHHQQVHLINVRPDSFHPRETRRTIFVVTDCETEKTQSNRKLIKIKQVKCQQRVVYFLYCSIPSTFLCWPTSPVPTLW